MLGCVAVGPEVRRRESVGMNPREPDDGDAALMGLYKASLEGCLCPRTVWPRRVFEFGVLE